MASFIFIAALTVTNFSFGYLTCETFSGESGDLFCCLQLVVQERNREFLLNFTIVLVFPCL